MAFQVRTRADTADKHTMDINTLVYHKGKLYSGADDGKIIAWQEDLSKSNEVKAHPTTVLSLTASGDSIFSCSNDGSIKSWTLDLQEKETVFSQQDEIYRITSAGGTLYSSDEQGVVRVHEGKEIKNIFNLLEPLKEIAVVGNLLYSVRDTDVVVTAMGEKENFQVVGTVPGRAPLAFAGDFLCFASRGGKDIVVHENNHAGGFKQVTEVKDAHGMIINAMVGAKTDAGAVIYTAGWDKVVKKWSIQDGACKLVASADADMVVNALAFGEKGEIYAGGSDGHIVRIDE